MLEQPERGCRSPGAAKIVTDPFPSARGLTAAINVHNLAGLGAGEGALHRYPSELNQRHYNSPAKGAREAEGARDLLAQVVADWPQGPPDTPAVTAARDYLLSWPFTPSAA